VTLEDIHGPNKTNVNGIGGKELQDLPFDMPLMPFKLGLRKESLVAEFS
jgi:hypothetical protein